MKYFWHWVVGCESFLEKLNDLDDDHLSCAVCGARWRSRADWTVEEVI